MRTGVPHWRLSAAALAFCFASGVAHAQEADPTKVLKAMTDYVRGQKAIAFAYDTDIEVVTPGLQKLQFTSSGNVLLNRPDKVRMTRTGGYADVELVFDGKIATVYGKNLNAYAQFDAAGTTEQLIDRIRDQTPVSLPGADLFGSFDQLTEDAYEATHIGRGVIDGVECEHLAFRAPDVDWQIWVEVGAQPIPRKYVITSKAVAGAPQYSLRIKDWKTNRPVAEDAFSFKAESGANKVDLAAIRGLDEVPEGTVPGVKR